MGADYGIVARDALHGEVSYNGSEERRDPYHLDADTRDILTANGRQDAAHALINTMTLLIEVTVLRRWLVMLLWLNVIALVDS